MTSLPQALRLSGQDKEEYLATLESLLNVLETGMLSLPPDYSDRVLQFGQQKGWDWARLPKEQAAYQRMAEVVEQVRQEYSWFMSIESPEPEKNRAYFDEIELSPESGLPGLWGFVTLGGIRQNVHKLMAETPGYDDTARSLQSLLLEDYAPVPEIPDKAQALRKDALRRNFLEQIRMADLLNWRVGTPPAIKARKVRSEGAEELWSITAIQYEASSGMFHLYIIDAWQDISEHVFQQSGEGVEISPLFAPKLNFGGLNEAWYILKAIDRAFPSLHPVHVSRGILGPWESRYTTQRLPILQALLKENPNSHVLRFTRQYSFAPNHEEISGELRQIVSIEDWRDEILVCPSMYAADVSRSVQGTDIKVLKA